MDTHFFVATATIEARRQLIEAYRTLATAHSDIADDRSKEAKKARRNLRRRMEAIGAQITALENQLRGQGIDIRKI